MHSTSMLIMAWQCLDLPKSALGAIFISDLFDGVSQLPNDHNSLFVHDTTRFARPY